MICYLSGKISGFTEKEYTDNFYFADLELSKQHSYLYSVSKIINPLDIKPLFGIKRWLFYMIADLWQLRKCTHIAMQPNWIDSKGAWLEYGFAKFIFKQQIIFLWATSPKYPK